MLFPEGEYCLLLGDRSDGALGHVSAQTTERYLRCKQRIREAVNDPIDIEPYPAARFIREGRRLLVEVIN
jgi:hypothetical protein